MFASKCVPTRQTAWPLSARGTENALPIMPAPRITIFAIEPFYHQRPGRLQAIDEADVAGAGEDACGSHAQPISAQFGGFANIARAVKRRFQPQAAGVCARPAPPHRLGERDPAWWQAHPAVATEFHTPRNGPSRVGFRSAAARAAAPHHAWWYCTAGFGRALAVPGIDQRTIIVL